MTKIISNAQIGTLLIDIIKCLNHISSTSSIEQASKWAELSYWRHNFWNICPHGCWIDWSTVFIIVQNVTKLALTYRIILYLGNLLNWYLWEDTWWTISVSTCDRSFSFLGWRQLAGSKKSTSPQVHVMNPILTFIFLLAFGFNIKQAGAASSSSWGGFERSRMFKNKEQRARSKEYGVRNEQSGIMTEEFQSILNFFWNFLKNILKIWKNILKILKEYLHNSKKIFGNFLKNISIKIFWKFSKKNWKNISKIFEKTFLNFLKKNTSRIKKFF